jgi:hypothetical protein
VFSVTTGGLIFDLNSLGRRYLEFLHTRGRGAGGNFLFCFQFLHLLFYGSEGKKGKGEKVKPNVYDNVDDDDNR